MGRQFLADIVNEVRAIRASGDPAAAAVVARTALADTPGHATLRLELCRAVLAQTGPAEALATLDAHPGPENPQLEAEAARCLRLLGRPAEALARLEDSGAGDGAVPEGALERVQALIALDRPEEALEVAETFARAFPQRPHLQTLRARLHRDAGDLTRAADAFVAALAAGAGPAVRAELEALDTGAPDRPEGAAVIADRAFDRMQAEKDPARQARDAEAGARRYPRHEGFQLAHARALAAGGKPDVAIDHLRARLAEPGPAAARFLAELLTRRGRTQEAMQVLADASRRAPGNRDLLVDWLRAVAEVKGVNRALDLARARLRDLPPGPQNRPVLQFILNRLMSENRHAEALALAEAEADTGGLAPGARMVGARAALEAGDVDRARELFTAAMLDLAPDGLVGPMMSVLGDLVFPLHRKRKLGILAARAARPRIAASARVRRDVTEGNFQTILDDYVISRTRPFQTDDEFFTALFACHDLGEGGHMRRILADRIADMMDDLGGLRGLFRTAATMCDAENAATAARRILALTPDAPVDRERVILWMAAAMGDGGAAHAEMAAEALIGVHRAGAVDGPLAYYLALNAGDLLERVQRPVTLRRVDAIRRQLPGLLQAHSILGQVKRERRLCRDILAAGGPPPAGLVTTVSPIHRADDLPRLRENLTTQRWPDLQALVMPNGPLLDRLELVRATFDDLDWVEIVPVADGGLARALNTGLKAAAGAYVLRVDSDDIYLPAYVHNTIAAMATCGADLAFKNSFFVWTQAVDYVVFFDRGPDYQRLVGGNGASQAMTADIARRFSYTEDLQRSEDIHLARAVDAAGGMVITTDPFDIVVVRHADKGRHTWNASDYFLYGTPYPVGRPDIIPSLSNPVFA